MHRVQTALLNPAARIILFISGSAAAEPSQQTGRVDPLVFQCWASAAGGGPTLKHQWVNSSCLLGYSWVGCSGGGGGCEDSYFCAPGTWHVRVEARPIRQLTLSPSWYNNVPSSQTLVHNWADARQACCLRFDAACSWPRGMDLTHISVIWNLLHDCTYPANTRHWSIVGSMLGQRRRPTLIQYWLKVSCLLGRSVLIAHAGLVVYNS